ncbi:metal ABC transporter solute-binding protein, Zn/Mn family [Reyranella sp.]|uniref:metal ABC transporter solute-binding protein, Zn/Mn family n=1 Tax=Reyranella sp. TaxID=1929291 RepID=UPI003BAD4238
MMQRRSFLAAAAGLACRPAAAGDRPKVVATFSILGDLVRQVAGDRVELAVLVGPDSDAHAYQPRPADARQLADAQVMVSNGLGFEGWIERLAKAAPFRGRAIVASTGVATLEAASLPGHAHAHGPDPHCWQDVGRTRRYVETIVAGLAAADPPGAAGYRERGAAYDRRLAILDAWIREEIGRVPAPQRRVITSHDAFHYFQAAYGVTFLAPRGVSTESEPSARDLALLIRQIREQKIRALFLENMGNPRLIEQIARETGGIVGPRLYSDSLSGPDGPAATYEAMMRHNAGALVAGMARN